MKRQLTAREASEKWGGTKRGLFYGAFFFLIAVLFLVAILCGGAKEICVFWAIICGTTTLCYLPYGVYGLIRYGKTGRLINRWVKITGEPTDNFPMSAVSRRGLRAWAKEELERVARYSAICTRYAQEDERSYKNALTAPYPSENIKPNGVRELERQVAARESAVSDLKRTFEGSKLREARARKGYDDWWDLLRDLKYDGYVGGSTSLLPFLSDGFRQFKNPAEFSRWIKDEDARRKKAEQCPEPQTGPTLASPEPPPLTNCK